MSKLSTCLKTLVAAAAVAGSVAAVATPIVGVMNFNADLVLVSNGNIDWNSGPATVQNPPNLVKTYGNFSVTASPFLPASGSFAAINGSAAQIQDMSSPQVWSVGGLANTFDANNFVVGAATMVPDFLKFAAKPNWHFDGIFLAAGAVISGIQTPFSFKEELAGLSVSISLFGNSWDDVNGNSTYDEGIDDLTKWRAIISTQYPQYSTVGEAVTALTSAGALDNNSWSGTLVVTRLPEPASLALVGLALAGLGFATRRRQVK